MITQKYQDIDLSVLVYGPDPPIGQNIDYPVQITYDYEDRFWTIAATVEQNLGGNPSINFAWLDDIENPSGGPPIAGGSVYSVDGDDYEIAAVKVATCYFTDNSGDFLEATFTFMQRATSGDDTDWEIGVITRTWEADGFPTGSYTTGSPVFWDDTERG